MDYNKQGICNKCGKMIQFNKDPFVPAICSCGHLQITPFKVDNLHVQKLLASSPLFLLFYGIYEDKNLFVNITLLRKDIPDYEWCLQTAKEQAEIIFKLRHHNTTPIFDYGEKNGYFTVISPFIDGYPLSSYSPDKQDLIEIHSIIDILQATALGMAVAHYHKIAHHDISPHNIHIDNRGTIRVKNFFISRFVYTYDQKRIEEKKHIYTSVSPHYISPEKVESGAEDERGDVFSFGVLFYYFLTGTFPFQGERELDTIYSRVKLKNRAKRGKITMEYDIAVEDFPDYIPPKKPKEIRYDIPAETSQLIMRMLSYYPNDRPTFAEVISEFNLLRAKANVIKIRKVQEEIIDSDTKDIPKMPPLFASSKKIKKEI